MKNIFLTTLLSFLIGSAISQNAYSFWLGMSPNFQSTKETRYTSTFRSGIGYVGTLGFSSTSEKRTLFFETEFNSTTIGASNISSTRNLQPNLQFSYLFQRPDKINFGPDLQLGTLLQFRNGVTSSNNQISYLIWNSLGLTFNKTFLIGASGRPTPIVINASVPLISYIIRPSYSFPFTDRFLEQENYNFDLDNLSSSIIRGGKIRTVNSFIHLKLGIEAYRFNKKNLGASIKYQINYLSYLKQKSLFQFTHQLIFSFIINNSK